MTTQPVSSRFHAAKTAFVDRAAARPALDGVQIASAHLGKETARESIQLVGEDDISQEWLALGRRSRDETLNIRGTVWVLKPGGGELVIREARARAFVLLAELERMVVEDNTLGGAVKQSRIRTGSVLEFANPDGRVCEAEFEVEIWNRLSWETVPED